jgi:hypothetical protein
MKCRLCPGVIVACAILAAGSLAAFTQPEKGGKPDHQMTPDMAEMMKALEASARPGPNHKLLERWVGKWDTTMRMIMPGAAPVESRGTAEFSWLMEGRWLQEKMTGDMMGHPMQGFSITGYDNFNKCFVSTWVDNHTTMMVHSSGSMDQSGKVLTMFGKMDEPMTGEHNKTVRFQTTIIDEDTHRLNIDEVQYGPPFTVLEITYKRVK